MTKKKEEKKEKESKGESTFGSWVWKTLKNIGEEICVSRKYKASVKGTRKRTDMKVHGEKYILGIKVENTEIESTMEDIIKDLSKEEWDWLAMDPKVVGNYRFSIPKEWDPPKDPRPEWRIKETQVQTKEEDAQRNIKKEKLQPKKHPVT